MNLNPFGQKELVWLMKPWRYPVPCCLSSVVNNVQCLYLKQKRMEGIIKYDQDEHI